MGIRAQNLEWHITESDEEWAKVCSAPFSSGQSAARHVPWEAMLLLVVLVCAGARWYQTRLRIQQTETELRTAVAAQTATATSLDPGATIRQDDSPSQSEAPAGDYPVEVRRFEIYGDQAVVYSNTPVQRQTLFYRRTSAGWEPVKPDPALWGPARTLETGAFVYHYQEKDAGVVSEVVPQIETLYAKMRATLGLPLPSTRGKTVIEVSLVHEPGSSRMMQKIDGPAQPASATKLPQTHYHLIVASPARYVAPAGVTDAELLAQSILLPLAFQVAREAVRRYQLEWPEPEETQLFQALYLWQVWSADLPLAEWREEVVRWHLHDLPQAKRSQAPPLPARYAELCAAHQLWVDSPREIGIPLTCTVADRQVQYWAAVYVPLRQTDTLPVPLLQRVQTREGKQVWIDWYGDAGVLAALLEFVVDEYGQAQLPAFLEGLARHRSISTLTPQVFGVSPAQFEASWQDYLREQYRFPGVRTISEF